MAKKRVVAHFEHEYEQAAAQQALSDIDETTESFMIGNLDESAISGLEQKGVRVQFLEEGVPVRTPAQEPIALGRARRVATAAPIAPPESATQIDEAKPNFYLVQLRGPLVARMRDALAAEQVQLLEYFPPRSYTARLTPDQARAVRDLSFVAGLRLYRAEDTGPILLQAAAPAQAPAPPPPPPAAAPPDAVAGPRSPARAAAPVRSRRRVVAERRGGDSVKPTHDIRLHRAEDSEVVTNWLKAKSCAISYARGRKMRIAIPDPAMLTQLADLPEVAEVAEYVPPELHNDLARVILGIDPANPGPGAMAAGIPQTGAGEIIGIADTGLDSAHPDFQGRIAGIACWGRPNDSSDPIGHGTHVAGSVLGDGSASAGQIRGAAPGARLFFQSLLDANGGLDGLPADLGDLFEQAYQNNVRIHNNSWGAATRSHYTIDSNDVDDFVTKRPDMLIVISAGNEGSAANPKFAQPGFVDMRSIGSPASAKNALTVGASRSSRTGGGYSTLTYGQAWDQDFPDPPIRDQHVSGDPDCLAAFSSRGPVRDQRLKPDVVAPGTDIASARSTLAPAAEFWGPYNGNAHYAFMGGTSMAAPLVAGCAALVREYFRTTRNHLPSAALLKATIINGARQLTGPDAVANHPTLPNMHQGFGRVHMPWTIPNPSLPALHLEFVDTLRDPAASFTETGQRRRYSVNVNGGAWLRASLVWTDPPGNARQHDLNVVVEHLQTRTKWYGNQNGFHLMNAGEPDDENTVEVVRIDNPPAGNYMLTVSAYNLLHPPQDFALVVTGELGGALQPYVGG